MRNHVHLVIQPHTSNLTDGMLQARMVMANLTKKLGAGTMTELAKQISRDPTSLAKLARKGELDVQVQNFTNILLASLTLGGC